MLNTSTISTTWGSNLSANAILESCREAIAKCPRPKYDVIVTTEQIVRILKDRIPVEYHDINPIGYNTMYGLPIESCGTTLEARVRAMELSKTKRVMLVE